MQRRYRRDCAAKSEKHGQTGPIVFLVALSIFCLALPATSSVDTVGPRPVLDSTVRSEALALVGEFFRKGSDPVGLDSSAIDAFAIDWFAELLYGRVDEPFWPIAHRFELGEVYAIRPENHVLMVSSRTFVDSLPYYGLVAVDWIWYLRRDDAPTEAQGSASDTERPWRISSVRRTRQLNEAISRIRMIDTSRAYPDAIKADVIAEERRILYDNDRLADHFAMHRTALVELVARFTANDSIRMIERSGERIRQFNRSLIDWGLAANPVPQEAIDQFMAEAPPETRAVMEQRLRIAARQESEGMAIVDEKVRKAGVRPSEVTAIITLMQNAGVRFVNREVPFRDGLLLTLAGNTEQAIGFLYSPQGELPWIAPEDFFYLEELGDGWWIYRSV